MTHPPRPLWGGRARAPLVGAAAELSNSIGIDRPLAPYDVAASRAWVAELAAAGLVDASGLARLDETLERIGADLAAGTFAWNDQQEDVHMNVEAAVRDAVGPELAGQLQAGRSRNEEVVADERLWLLDAAKRLDDLLVTLQWALARRAQEELTTALPAHTHTQPAQPVLLTHHLL